jgi:hypothetical protein
MVNHLKQKWNEHLIALMFHDYDRALFLIDELQNYAPDHYFDQLIKNIETKKISEEATREQFWNYVLERLAK